MQEMLTESELSLMHALQVTPRATWSDLAPILGTTAATLARRWQSITERGLAWITAYPAPLTGGGSITAIIEVTCGRADSADLVDALVRDPRVVSIEHAARGRDLVLTVQTSTLDELSGLVLDELPGFAGVQSTQTHTCTALHVEGSRWRLDSLDGTQLAAIAALGDASDRPGSARPESLTDDVARSLVGELTGNGRASAPEIASALGGPRPPSVVSWRRCCDRERWCCAARLPRRRRGGRSPSRGGVDCRCRRITRLWRSFVRARNCDCACRSPVRRTFSSACGCRLCRTFCEYRSGSNSELRI